MSCAEAGPIGGFARLGSFKLAHASLGRLMKTRLAGGATTGVAGVLQWLGRRPSVPGRSGRVRQGCKSRFDFLQIFLAEILQSEHHVAGVSIGTDELVEFELDGSRVTVLRVLEEEDHQEGYDGRASVDDELPCVGVVEEGACDRPGDDYPPATMKTLARPHCWPVQWAARENKSDISPLRISPICTGKAWSGN